MCALRGMCASLDPALRARIAEARRRPSAVYRHMDGVTRQYVMAGESSLSPRRTSSKLIRPTGFCRELIARRGGDESHAPVHTAAGPLGDRGRQGRRDNVFGAIWHGLPNGSEPYANAIEKLPSHCINGVNELLLLVR
jgi:hypothetical protein